MPRKLIKDFEPNQFVDGAYAIFNAQLGQTKTGKPFLKCLLGDKSGRTPGRMWSISEELFKSLPTDGFVWIEGQTQPYQGEMQVIVQNIQPYEPTQADLAELLPCTKFDIDEMFADLSAALYTLKHPAIKALVDCYLFDDALMDRFKHAPAAMSLHHAFLGGLLEHTLQLIRLAEAVLPLYPLVNRDLVMTGLFLHDMAKCAELTWETGFGYSDDGQLVGHVARGVVWLHDKARASAEKGTVIPEPILRCLTHIILSHHGVPEFGALKIPSTPEAIAVSHIDNLDAKLHMALAAADREHLDKDAALGGHFTEKVWALETRIYRPDPTLLPERDEKSQ
ncbi:MAG: HD domain-containing protein [Phycisphaera sp.]|nr:HD domain-containing protein [Phycisphaera sp.]